MRLRPSRKPEFRAVAVLCAGAAVVFLIARWPPLTTKGDFVWHFYPTAKELLNGHLHYATPRVYTSANIAIFRYPPIAALLLAPFALLPLKAAAVAWWIVGLVLAALSAWWLASLFAQDGRRAMYAGILLAVFVAFAPFGNALPRQIDVWITALIAAAFVLSTRGGRRGVFAAGVLLGLAASIKVYPLLTIAVIAWLRRDEARPLLAGAAACSVVCLLAPCVLLGTTPLMQYVHTLSTQGSPVLVAYPFAFGFLSIAYRALVATPYTTSSAHLSPTLVKGLFVLFVLCVLAFVAVSARSRTRARGIVWSVALLTTAACSPFLEVQHLAPLVLILPFLAADAKPAEPASLATSQVVSRKLRLIALAFGACSVLSLGLGHPLALIAAISLLVAAGLGGYLLVRGHPLSRLPRASELAWSDAIFGAAMVFVGTPAFLRASTLFGVPVSPLHVVLGSADFVCVLLILVTAPRLVASTGPLERARSPARRPTIGPTHA